MTVLELVNEINTIDKKYWAETEIKVTGYKGYEIADIDDVGLEEKCSFGSCSHTIRKFVISTDLCVG